MEVWLMVLASLVGACIAVIAMDFMTRNKLIKELDKTKREFSDSIVKINQVHNDLAQKVLEMHDKVNAHDFQLNARAPSSMKKRS